MSALAFKGTSIDQDPRWAKALAKRKKQMKFPAIFATKVDMSRINRDQFKKWTEKRLVELFDGLEDEILINYVHGYLEQSDVNPEDMLMSLNDMLELDTVAFMEELWTLLVDAQTHTAGIPKAFSDAAKFNIDARYQERDRINQGMRRAGHSNPQHNYRTHGDSFESSSRTSPLHSQDNRSSDRYGLDSRHSHRSSHDEHKFDKRGPPSQNHSDHTSDIDTTRSSERHHPDNQRYGRDSASEWRGSSRPGQDGDRQQHYGQRHPRDRRYNDSGPRDGRPRDSGGRRGRDDFNDHRRSDYDDDKRSGRRYDQDDIDLGDVDIFGRDARPSRGNESSSLHSNSSSRHDGRRSPDRSSSLAEEYAHAALQSKKRSHEPNSDDEIDVANAKRPKRP